MHRHRVTSPRLRKRERIRLGIQLGFAALLNGYTVGFAKGSIFKGKTKLFCVPVLNCYSCPGALGSCPIGALQAVLNGRQFPFYVLGIMMLFGVLCGRLLCGFICPFGLLQDLLSRIPVRKLTLPKKIDRPARLLKYIVLVVPVILLPLFFYDEMGSRSPTFCEFFCPAGTLEAGIPLVLLNGNLRELVGGLFYWKIGVLSFLLLGALFVPRFFCRYFCPLGAFYAFFKIDYHGMTAGQLADYILEKAGILVVPGTAFGEGGEKCIRLSFAADAVSLETAIDRMRKIFT